MSDPLSKQTEIKSAPTPEQQPALETVPDVEVVTALEGEEGSEVLRVSEPSADQGPDQEIATPLARNDEPKPTSAAVTTPVVKDKLTGQIEEIMSEDLTDVFLGMPAEVQQEFKVKGEEAASTIKELLTAVKINARKIFEVLRNWLRIIPGVNRFFLEQEAKIKTDKILRLKP